MSDFVSNLLTLLVVGGCVFLMSLLIWVILKSVLMTERDWLTVEAAPKETCPMCERLVSTHRGENGDKLDWHSCPRCGDYATFRED